MKRGGRALLESLVLHGLMAGAMIALAGSLTPPPQTIRLDLCMLEPTQPKPTAPVAAASPAPPLVKPTPPAPQSKPAPHKPKPVAVRPKPKTVKPKPVPAAIKPTPPRPRGPAPEVAAAIPEPAPLPAAPPAETPPGPETAAPPDPPLATAKGEVETESGKQRPAPSPAAGRAEAVEEYRHANFGTIRSSILANLRYPLLARRQGWSGLVEVAFLVAPDGSVSDLRIQASSGFPVLDDQALAAVRRSAPFTPPRIAALLVVPVTFRLN